MKTATFECPIDKQRTIYGKVTLKDDGKVSISLQNGNYFSYMARTKARNLANKIVDANFKHEAVLSFHETTQSLGLVPILTEKTQELKTSFIDKTKKWTKIQFDRLKNLNARTTEEWYDAYGLKYTMEQPAGYDKPYPVLERGTYNRREVYSMQNKMENVQSTINAGYEKFEADAVKRALRHYEDSIAKLAYRLNQKGIVDGSDFEVTTAAIGVNLEITIKHGNETTRAWTIWASGIVQRPHYRYLVK